MSVRACVCVRACAHTCTHVCTCTHACLLVWVHVCAPCLCARKSPCTPSHACVCKDVHACICVYQYISVSVLCSACLHILENWLGREVYIYIYPVMLFTSHTSLYLLATDINCKQWNLPFCTCSVIQNHSMLAQLFKSIQCWTQNTGYLNGKSMYSWGTEWKETRLVRFHTLFGRGTLGVKFKFLFQATQTFSTHSWLSDHWQEILSPVTVAARSCLLFSVHFSTIYLNSKNMFTSFWDHYHWRSLRFDVDSSRTLLKTYRNEWQTNILGTRRVTTSKCLVGKVC